MKRKIVTMVITISILLLMSVMEQAAVEKITGRALENTHQVIEMIRRGELQQAKEKSQEMDVSWYEQAKWLEMMVDHSSTDEVRYAFSRLIAALEEEDSATAMVYAFELEGAIEHVYERQALTLENII